MAGDFFLKLGDIKGESDRSGEIGTFEILGWGFGAANNMQFTTSSGGMATGRGDVMELQLQKQSDTADPQLWASCLTGKIHPSATLHGYRTGGNKSVKYLAFKMTNVALTNIQVSGSDGGGLPMMSLGLAYQKIQWTQTKLNEDGTPGDTIVEAWDVSSVESK